MAATLTKTNTPGIYRRHVADCGGGRCDCPYVVVWRHRGRQHKATFPTLAEAREAKGSRDAGDTRPASREPFADYARQWLDSYRGRTARGLAERTRRLYRRDMERWAIPYFRGRRLEEVEPPDVRAFVRHLERKGLRPASIRSVLAPVKAMYATAVEDGAVRFNPTRGLRIADNRNDTRKPRALTPDQLTRLLGHLPDEWRLLFEFLSHTGLRISEAIGLTWADVEFGDRPRLRVRRQDCRGEVGALKSEHSRRDVPLSPGMAARLWALGADRPGTERVFTSPQGLPLRQENVRRRVLIPATQAAGLGHLDNEGEWRTWVTFHTFRHTCGSLLFKEWRDAVKVGAWLGHADPAFTLRTYVHEIDDAAPDAAFLDAITGPNEDAEPAQNETVGVGQLSARGNTGATGGTETAVNGAAAAVAESAD